MPVLSQPIVIKAVVPECKSRFVIAAVPLLISLLASVPLMAASLPQDSRRPGGIAVVPVSADTTRATLNGDQVALVQAGQQRYAIVGIPLKQPVGRVTFQTNQGPQSFAITPYPYTVQRITLKDSSKVDPNAAQLARYKVEAREQAAAFRIFSDGPADFFPAFRVPTAGTLTGSFGSRRIFNGQPRNPHSGLDIAAPQGQVVMAPAAGTVVATGDYFFNGQTVMIDHGKGVVSMLCHLSRIDVQKGQRLQIGQPIGLVGKTGRATGPHLHWTLSLNDARVDPKLVLGSR